jgi:biotin carboxylase
MHLCVVHDAAGSRYIPLDYAALAAAGCRLTVISDPQTAPKLKLPDECCFIALDSIWQHLDALSSAVRKVHARNPIDRLFGLLEGPQMTLAALRDELGLDGPSQATMRAYRNKIEMKKLVSRSRLRVPRYAELATDQQPALDPDLGFPLIVKPVARGGGVDVMMASDMHELTDALSRYRQIGHRSADVEELIRGDFFHCDALMSDGELCFFSVGQYSREVARMWEPLHFVASVLMPPSSAAARSIRSAALEALHALPLRSVSAHLELFRADDGEWIFCECAARPGGARIPRCIEESWGVDFPTLTALRWAGMRPRIASKARWSASAYVMLFAPTSGSVVSTRHPHLPSGIGTADWRVHHMPGATVQRETLLCDGVLIGESFEQLQACVQQLDDSRLDQSGCIDDWARIQPAPSGPGEIAQSAVARLEYVDT